MAKKMAFSLLWIVSVALGIIGGFFLGQAHERDKIAAKLELVISQPMARPDSSLGERLRNAACEGYLKEHVAKIHDDLASD